MASQPFRRGRGTGTGTGNSRGRSNHQQEVKKIITDTSYNYAKYIKISDSKPIIIPIGFDCGPSTLLRGSLVEPRNKEPKTYNIVDLPFDTIILKESTPIITDFMNIIEGIDINKLSTDTKIFNHFFTNPSISFEHQYSYDNNTTFKNDMIIRIINLLFILSTKDDLNCKIFFRKSHSDYHHTDATAYKSAADSKPNDLQDAINLSKYLKSLQITNFKIVLYLCCKQCYDDNINFNGKNIYDKDKHILCVRTIDTIIRPEKAIDRTMPPIFGDSAYKLFKDDVEQITKDTTYTKFCGMLNKTEKWKSNKYTPQDPCPEPESAASAAAVVSAAVSAASSASAATAPASTMTVHNNSKPKHSSICNLVSNGTMTGGTMKKKTKTIKKTKKIKTTTIIKKN